MDCFFLFTVPRFYAIIEIVSFAERSDTVPKKSKSVPKMKRLAIFQTIVILALVGVLILVVYKGMHKAVTVFFMTPDSGTPAEFATDDEEPTNEDGMILMHDSAYGEVYLPVLEGVEKCSYDIDRIVRRNSMCYYMEDTGVSSAIGVDVSSHQGEIDWPRVKEAGISFAFLRCGLRTYGSGKLEVDPCFDRNLAEATAAGLDVGVYFFSQAISVEEAEEEAEMTLALLDGAPLTYPIVFDWEVVTTDHARTDDVSVETLGACTRAFCEKVKAAGYTPMVYQNKRTSYMKLDLRQTANYDFWLAEYAEKPSYYYEYRIWQYCSDGTVPGIEGDVDMNLCFVPYTKGGDGE